MPCGSDSPSLQSAAENCACSAAIPTVCDGSGGGIAGAPRGENSVRLVSLGDERRPDWNVIIPFDQRRQRSGLRDDLPIEVPDSVADRAVMGVDEERRAVRVSRLEIAREVDLAGMFEREGFAIF